MTQAGNRKQLLAYGHKKMRIAAQHVEPQLVGMLSLRMVMGDTTALDDPESVILSQSAAHQLFGDRDPIGKIIQLDNDSPAKVTGVFADIPPNTHFANTDYIRPFSLLVRQDDLDNRVGRRNWFQVYVQLNPNADLARVSSPSPHPPI
jgi:hypothetical protein